MACQVMGVAASRRLSGVTLRAERANTSQRRHSSKAAERGGVARRVQAGPGADDAGAGVRGIGCARAGLSREDNATLCETHFPVAVPDRRIYGRGNSLSLATTILPPLVCRGEGRTHNVCCLKQPSAFAVSQGKHPL